MVKLRQALGYILYVFIGSWLPHYQLGHSWPLSTLFKRIIAKLLLIKCGSKVDIGRNVSFSFGVSLGDRSSIGDNAYLNGEISIGNDVMMAANCALIGSNHNYLDISIPMNKQGFTRKGIKIEDNVWIGYGVIILDGVTIKSGSIIAAGSVVTSDVEKNSIVGGVPAKLIKKRME